MLMKEQLKQILIEQRNFILHKNFGIEREILGLIEKYKKLPHITVITGLRRSGKSTFLRQVIKNYYSDKDFYYINFEDERFLNFKAENFNDIYESLIELFGEEKTFFIDEIQNVSGFENFVRRFYDMGFKFFITGSNANLLSKEIGTKLTGRHIDIEITPFSFKEFLQVRQYSHSKYSRYKSEEKGKLKQFFEEYLFKGGMPEYLLYEDPEILTRIYEDIIIKDIAVRYGISSVYEMRELFQYIVTNFGNRLSFTRLKNIIGFGSVNTVKNYLLFLGGTFFISLVNKFDHSPKKQLVNDKKIYVIDNGFIPRISTKITRDKGWLLENLVYNVLKKQATVYYFHTKKAECDFILLKGKIIIQAVQVCWELTQENEDREIKGLLTALDFFELNNGLILTRDQENELEINQKKIVIKPVWKWLLEEKKTSQP